MLVITSQNLQGEYQELSLGSNNLEVACDLVTRLVNSGITLLTVELVDTEECNRTIPLPIAAFDGVPLREPIEQLMDDCLQLLG